VYTHAVERPEWRAEELITLSGAARRIADLVAAAGVPVRYEVLRHLLRVSEETMTEVLEEAVRARLVTRADDPFTYIPHDPETGAALVDALGADRAKRMRQQIESAARRVFDDQ
jgi:hypothetical protein